MLPTDIEFTTLYIVYGITFIFFVTGFFLFKKKRDLLKNFIFFITYTVLMIFIFTDKSNFEYDSSLVVLFYGGFFILLHLIIFILRRLFLLIFKKI